jgi:hypothetical protein
MELSLSLVCIYLILKDKTERFVLLSEDEGILEGWIVSSGSSRLRIAFNTITNSDR